MIQSWNRYDVQHKASVKFNTIITFTFKKLWSYNWDIKV